MRTSRNRLLTEWGILLAGLLLLGGFIGYSLQNEHAEIEAKERERLLSQVRVLHANVARQIDSANRVLVNVRSDLPEWRHQPDGMQRANRHLAAFVETLPGVRTILILDRTGQALAASRAELRGMNFAERPYFTVPQQGGDPRILYVTAPFRTPLGIWAMNVTRVVVDEEGGFAGVVTATLDPEMFRILLDSLRYVEDTHTALIHGDGLIFMTDSSTAGQFAGANLATPNSLFSRHVAGGEPESIVTGIAQTLKVPRIAAFSTIHPENPPMDRPLVAMVSHSPEAIFAAWQRRARGLAGFFVLLAAISVASLFVMQRRRRLVDNALEEIERVRQTKTTELESLVALRTADLAFAKEAAETANRAKTTFLATMSHELRTPLNGIVGCAALARQRVTDPKVQEYLATIERASQSLTGLINDVLDIAKVEAERLTLEHTPFRLGEVIENVRSLTGHQVATKGLELVFICPDAISQQWVCGDSLRLGQVLINLINNAVKFTQRGSIRVAFEEIADGSEKFVLFCEVRDTGIGISLEDQGRIFRPFVQVEAGMNRRFGGSGLGLAICKQLVEMMDGEIDVESTPGEGSAFWFTVALDRAEKQPTPPTARAASPPA